MNQLLCANHPLGQSTKPVLAIGKADQPQASPHLLGQRSKPTIAIGKADQPQASPHQLTHPGHTLGQSNKSTFALGIKVDLSEIILTFMLVTQ